MEENHLANISVALARAAEQLSPLPEPSISAKKQVASAAADTSNETEFLSTPPSGLIDTSAAISTLIDTLVNLPTNPPSLYIDLEGIYLSRFGSISILQLLVAPTDETYLLDVHILGDKVFSTSGTSGSTFKTILESASIPKVFFDVRIGCNTSLPEEISEGPVECIESGLGLTYSEKQQMKNTKEAGLKLFAPEHGGSYEVFNIRPLPNQLRLYCLQDVRYMPRLWLHYNARLGRAWANKVQEATKDRVALSQSKSFNGKGQHMALAPTGWF
ncbi:hypothetical protein LSUE1_G002967 [Lachnellula suecica]|uniref:3'-5' exonuclease domain-containing protein n=1 Tax=Lachnellula suecica TaxID=602035 RepID=A0A8T9CC96_9HELO|nr:hypothetical protein LSUE1_G002967 [Lachnellula suecica]